VVLISGQGSNMEALVRASEAEEWPARIVAVLSNSPGAPGLAFARARWHRGGGRSTTRPTPTVRPSTPALAAAIERHAPDLVVLAGFMRILTPEFVRRHEGRMMNIHPSLLPSFTGLDTHRRAIEAGCKLAGATVHFVGNELDHGPIVAQAAVPVLAGRRRRRARPARARGRARSQSARGGLVRARPARPA
jgi:phosphoribosylglycinamide formyltransferase-1